MTSEVLDTFETIVFPSLSYSSSHLLFNTHRLGLLHIIITSIMWKLLVMSEIMRRVDPVSGIFKDMRVFPD